MRHCTDNLDHALFDLWAAKEHWLEKSLEVRTESIDMRMRFALLLWSAIGCLMLASISSFLLSIVEAITEIQTKEITRSQLLMKDIDCLP